MARSQVDGLAKIGLEGFALVEECYGKSSGRSNNKLPSSQGHQAADHYHHHHRQQPYVYHGPQVYTVKQAVSNTSSEAAAQYYGEPRVYQRPQVSTVRGPLVSTNIEATHYYYGRPSVCQQGHQVTAVEEVVINSNDAARYYGGMVITDFRKKKTVTRAYY